MTLVRVPPHPAIPRRLRRPHRARPRRRLVAGVPHPITIRVRLVRVLRLRAIVAGVANQIAVEVRLVIDDPRAGVAGVADPITIPVALVWVGEAHAVVVLVGRQIAVVISRSRARVHRQAVPQGPQVVVSLAEGLRPARQAVCLDPHRLSAASELQPRITAQPLRHVVQRPLVPVDRDPPRRSVEADPGTRRRVILPRLGRHPTVAGDEGHPDRTRPIGRSGVERRSIRQRAIRGDVWKRTIQGHIRERAIQRHVRQRSVERDVRRRSIRRRAVRQRTIDRRVDWRALVQRGVASQVRHRPVDGQGDAVEGGHVPRRQRDPAIIAPPATATRGVDTADQRERQQSSSHHLPRIHGAARSSVQHSAGPACHRSLTA